MFMSVLRNMFRLGYFHYLCGAILSSSLDNILDISCYNKHNNGTSYRGMANTTVKGNPCLNWKLSNSTYSGYTEDHSYCRNPLPISKQIPRPWCYINQYLVYGECNVPICETDTSSLKMDMDLCSKGCTINNSVCDNAGQCICKPGWYGDNCNYTNDCKLKEEDRNYHGNVSVSKSGFSCLYWNDSTYHKFWPMQHNYCRAPVGDADAIPWCYIRYTKMSGRYWELCDVPICVCQPGSFGENCEKNCHCKTSGCYVVDGHCYDPGCVDDWSGDSCNECQIGRFGNNCQHSCHCKTPGCAALSGHCTDGCSEGWKGDSCNVCAPGYFGVNCEKRCHCAINGCDAYSGVCYNQTAGCNIPWTERNCSILFSCPDLEMNSDDHLLSTKKSTVYHINDTIDFLCNTGYTVSGPTTLTCVVSDRQTEGRWNGRKPSCKCLETAESHTIPVGRIGIYMSYGLFGGVLTAIVIISAGVYIGACFYHRRRIRKHITIYEDLQFKFVQRQTISNDDTYVELQ